MTETSFPAAVLYTWSSSNAVEDINRVLAQLTRTSPAFSKWEVETVLKIPKNQRSGPALSKGALAASTIGTYFVNLSDIRIKCIIPKSLGGNIVTDIDGTIEEKKTRDESLILRSTWAASGQRFHIGDCIISVGFITHAGSAQKPCIEIIFVQEDSSSPAGSSPQNYNIKLTVEKLHNIVSDLLLSNEVSCESLVSSQFIDSLERRAMQWLIAMIR